MGGCQGIPDKDSPLANTGRTDGEAYVSAETDIFYIHPYYWGEDEKAQDMPNFFYKPEGIEIQWYKYPMRDAYSNVELTGEKVQEIIGKCEESIPAPDTAPDPGSELKAFAENVDGIEYLEERTWLWEEDRRRVWLQRRQYRAQGRH